MIDEIGPQRDECRAGDQEIQEWSLSNTSKMTGRGSIDQPAGMDIGPVL